MHPNTLRNKLSGVIAFPVTVTGLLDKPANVDLNKVRIDIPQIELPPLDFGPPAK